MELLEHDVLDNIRVDLCHAVDRVAADDGQIRHAHLAVPQDGGCAQVLGGIGLRHIEALAPAAIDLVDDLVDTGEQGGEGGDGPLLERLGQDGVVGVGHRVGHDLPGLVPRQALFVHKNAHELRAAHGRMCIVGVDGDVAGQFAPVVAVFGTEGVEQGGDSGGDEQVFLLESQQAPVLAGVVGIEDRGDGLGVRAVTVGTGVVAGVECRKVEVLVHGFG